MPPICAFGCPPNGAPMHRFPNPEKFPEKFEVWVSLVGGKLENASDYEFHRKRRMCSIHFTDADRNRNSRLNALAVPSLHLPGKPAPEYQYVRKAHTDHNYCTGAPRHSFPHPVKNRELFLAWLSVVGDKLKEKDPMKIFKYNKICHFHFELDQKTTSRRITFGAVPSLNLNGVSWASVITEIDHSYCAMPPTTRNQKRCENDELRPGAKKPTDDSIRLPDTGDSVRSPEADDHVEVDTFDNEDFPLSLDPEIAPAVQDTKQKEEIVFSWQKTELIETDDTEDLIPEPVSDDPTPRDGAVTLSSFCEPEPPSVPCEPTAAPAPEAVENLCQVCGAVENGYHYWCVSCYLGALCGACAATLTHELHFVLRAPTAATKEQTQTIIAVLRQQLEKENLLRMFETEENQMKVEVKQESEELPILYSLEPDILSHLDPLAGHSELFVNPEVPQEQIEVIVTEGSTESFNTERAVSETMATDVDVEFVRETIDHHQFKRPRLMEYRQSINPATKNVQLPLLKHPNVIGSQSMISNSAGPTTVQQIFQTKQDTIKNLQAKGLQTISPEITRVGQFKTSLEEYRKMLKNRRQNPKPESGTIQNTSKVKSVPNIVVAPLLTEETTDLDEIQFLDEYSEYQDLLDKVTRNETDENESNRDLRKQTVNLTHIQFLGQRKKDNQNQTVKTGLNRDIRTQKKTNDISDTESVFFTDDDTDKEYRIDEDDISELSDDSMDWDGVNVSERGVGRRTRNATKLAVKGPCEAMLRSLPSEATVTLRPLTSLEISKWTAYRKRRKED